MWNEDKYEFHIQIVTTSGNCYNYNIEADSLDDAMNIAEELFFTDDYLDEEIEEMWWIEED